MSTKQPSNPRATAIAAALVMLVAAMAAQQARGQAARLASSATPFESFAIATDETPNDIAIARSLDFAVRDPRAAELIGSLVTSVVFTTSGTSAVLGAREREFRYATELVPVAYLGKDLDLIDPHELTSMMTNVVLMEHVGNENLEQQMEDIRAGSSGFSVNGLSLTSAGFDEGLAGPSGAEGESGKSVNAPTSAPGNRWGAYLTGLGEFSDVSSTSDASGYNLDTGGFTLGGDYRISNNFAVGLTGGYTHTDVNLSNNGDVYGDSGQFALYATAFTGGLYGDAAVTGGYDSYSSRRTALFGTASGSTDGGNLGTLFATGYDWKSGGLTIGPTADFQYTHVSIDGFTEHGSLAPLSIQAQQVNSLRTSLGMKATYSLKIGPFRAVPELRAAWQHEYGDSTYSLESNFASGAGIGFKVYGPSVGRDTFLLRAGFSIEINSTFSIYAYYDGELATDNYESNNVSAGVRMAF
jgi:outer membrane autotransporter protein